MKFKIIYTSMALLFGAFILLSNSSGRALIANEGNTGAPGDNAPNGRTCQSCHNGAGIQVTLDIEVEDATGNIISEYTPGEVYTARVIVNTAVGNPQQYGFQMVSEVDADNSATNSWLNPASNVQVASTTAGRSYAEHKGASSSNIFEVQWEAPAPGTGSVTFYAAGNGVNGNGTSSGDGAATTSFSLSEGTVNSTAATQRVEPSLSIFPNPALDQVQLNAQGITPDPVTITVLDQQGKMVLQQLLPGQPQMSMQVGNLPAGIYFIQLDQNGNRWIEKVIKV
jgi:hypothetical protein